MYPKEYFSIAINLNCVLTSTRKSRNCTDVPPEKTWLYKHKDTLCKDPLTIETKTQNFQTIFVLTALTIESPPQLHRTDSENTLAFVNGILHTMPNIAQILISTIFYTNIHIYLHVNHYIINTNPSHSLRDRLRNVRCGP